MHLICENNREEEIEDKPFNKNKNPRMINDKLISNHNNHFKIFLWKI